MATRFYFPSSGTAPTSPAFGSGWATTPNSSRMPLRRFRSVTAMTSKTEVGTATSPEFILYRQYVSEPLHAQAIASATVKGQFRAWQSNAGKNATLAFAMRLVRMDGSDYGTVKTLVGATPAASDDTATIPPEFAGTTAAAIINRRLQDSAESFAPAVTDRAVDFLDRLVIEIGIRDASTSTTQTASISFGDDSATDLAENSTDTAASNPWVEITTTLRFYEPVSFENFKAVKVGDGFWTSERIR